MNIEPLTFGTATYLPRAKDEERSNLFVVTFVIGYTEDSGGVDIGGTFELAVGVPVEDGDQPYTAIELAGARLLPATLRDLADAVERDLGRSDRERAQRAQSS